MRKSTSALKPRAPSRRKVDHHELDLLHQRLASQELNAKTQVEALKLQVSALQQRLKLVMMRLESLERETERD